MGIKGAGEPGSIEGKAKYLIGVILDPVLAVFKFLFHEIFVVTIKYYCRVGPT